MPVFRPPTDDDWLNILRIADLSVAEVPGVPSQEEWMNNRRTFARRGRQVHFVRVEHDSLTGYGALEQVSGADDDGYRLFVVAHPDQLDTVGNEILDRLTELLGEHAATSSWFVEYAQATQLIGFIQSKGYREARRFTLASGHGAVVLSMPHTRR